MLIGSQVATVSRAADSNADRLAGSLAVISTSWSRGESTTMNWNRSYGVRSYLKSSLWVVPFVAIPLAVIVSRSLHGLDAWLGWRLLD
jgi:hypothetical protein